MRLLGVFDRVSPHHGAVATRLVQKYGVSLEILCDWSEHPPLDRALVPQSRMVCRGQWDRRARSTLHAQLQTGHFDLVYAHDARALANVLAASRGVRPLPRLVGYRGRMSRLQPFDPSNWLTFWHPRLSKIICESHATARLLQKSGIAPAKLATVWEGCDAGCHEQPDAAAIRERFEIPRDAFVIGMIANMSRVKGADLLLRAARQLADLPNAYWLLIGEVRDAAVRQLARHPGIAERVRLAGPHYPGIHYAAAFDLYVSAARREGIPTGLIEAMSCGVCPIATDVGGCSELIRDQRDGHLAAPESPSALAQAIRLLHGAPEHRQRLAASARHRATTIFSVEAWAERLFAAFSETLGGASARAA